MDIIRLFQIRTAARAVARVRPVIPYKTCIIVLGIQFP